MCFYPRSFSKHHRVVVRVEEDVTVQKVTALMDRQNTGLNSKTWILVKGSEKKETTSSHFAALVDGKAMQALKACNYRLHCGTQKATIKPSLKKLTAKQMR